MNNTNVRALRRLNAAVGYLELGLPANALEELASVTGEHEYQAELLYLQAEALKAQNRFGDAIEPLQRAVQLFSPAERRPALLSLSECYRKGGHTALAEAAEMFADIPQVTQLPAYLVVRIEQIPADWKHPGAPSDDQPSDS